MNHKHVSHFRSFVLGFAFTTGAALLLPCAAWPAESTAPTIAKDRIKPAQTITVKNMPPSHFEARAKGAAFVITTVDQDSCTAWVPTPRSGRDLKTEIAAYTACWQAIGKENGVVAGQ